MAKGLMGVLVAALLAGLATGSLWGRLPGVGVFAAVAVLGAVAVVLRRNQRDLHALEAGVPPGDVGDAIREPPPLEPHRRPPGD